MKNIILALIITALILGGGYYYIFTQYPQSISPTVTTQSTVTETSTTEKTSEPEYYEDISADEAYTLITKTDPDTVIIDVSPLYERGHLPNAINYYLGNGSLEIAIPTLDKEANYLVYCHATSASILGAKKLGEAGFTNVHRLDGDFEAWKIRGYPIEIPLQPVNNNQFETAMAAIGYFDGNFTHTIKTSMQDPAPGKFYEGWLVKGKNFFSTGKLEKENGIYKLQYTAKKDYRDYNNVVITEETEANGLDNKPETHLFEGEFE